jgi:hypothetical protein
MFLTAVETDIYANPEKVFSYIADLETMKDYNSSVKEAVWKEKGKICKIKIQMSVMNFNSEYIVTEFNEGKKIVAKCKASGLEFEDSYEFTPTEKGTHLKIIDRMELHGLMKLSEPILAPILKHEMHANLMRLKSIMEKN